MSKQAESARKDLTEYLDAYLLPFPGAPESHRERVADELKVMTPAERIFLEIEMQARAKAVHSTDYEPF